VLDVQVEEKFVNVGGKMGATIGINCGWFTEIAEKFCEALDDGLFVVSCDGPSVRERAEIIGDVEDIFVVSRRNRKRTYEIHPKQIEGLKGQNRVKGLEF